MILPKLICLPLVRANFAFIAENSRALNRRLHA